MTETEPSAAPLQLERDLFLRRLLRELTGTLSDVVGEDHAAGYISTVGGSMGRWIGNEYRVAAGVRRFDRAMVAKVLVDLKERINGDFYIIEETPEKIVLGNRRCPFGDMVIGRRPLCMMTSNVFGRIAADNLGYARVELQETIAAGHPGCLVVVHLVPQDSADPEDREYFSAASNDDPGAQD